MNKKVFLISTLSLLRRVPIFVTLFYIPLIFLDFGFNGFQIGILFSLFTITSLLFTLPTGITNDILSIKKLIIIGFVILFGFYFSLSLTTNFWIYTILFFIGGIGANITETSLNSLILKVKTNKTGKKLGTYYSLSTTGVIFAFILGGYLLSSFDALIIFRYSSFAFLLLALLSLFIPKTSTIKFELLQYKKDVFKKPVLLFIFVLFLYSIHWGAEVVSYTPFLEKNLGLTRMGVGIYMSIAIIFLSLSAYITGIKIDKKIDLNKALYLGLILSGITHILMTYPNLYSSIFFRMIHEAGDGIVQVLMLMGVTKLFHIDRIGGLASFVWTIMITGQFLGSLIFGQIGFKFGYHIPLIASGISTLIAFVIAYTRRKSMEH